MANRTPPPLRVRFTRTGTHLPVLPFQVTGLQAAKPLWSGILGEQCVRVAVRSSSFHRCSPWNRTSGLGVMLPVRVRGRGAVSFAAAHGLAFRLVLCHSVARFLRGSTSRPARRFSPGLL